MTPSDNAKVRVQIELEDLVARTSKLSEFMNTGAYDKLSDVQKGLLQAQRSAMITYDTILRARLAYWSA